MKIKCLFMLIVVGARVIAQDSIINIPGGKCIMMDGNILKTEWSDAKQMIVSSSINLLLKKTPEYILIGVDGGKGCNIIADLYCTNNNQLYNLHASAKLGQRNYQDTAWKSWV
jgi:hypothetical protein